MDPLFEEYIDTKDNPSTRRTIRNGLTIYGKWLDSEGKGPHDVDDSDLERFRGMVLGRALSTSFIQQTLRSVRNFYQRERKLGRFLGVPGFTGMTHRQDAWEETIFDMRVPECRQTAMDMLRRLSMERLDGTPTAYRREIASSIDWVDRLTVLRGQRGMGKTTIACQHVIDAYGAKSPSALYIDAGSWVFSVLKIVSVARRLAFEGGRCLVIDNADMYGDLVGEIWQILDRIPGMRVIACGSPYMPLHDETADLRQVADVHDIPGLSFREYLVARTGKYIPAFSLEELLSGADGFCTRLKRQCSPLDHFEDYLRYGYYTYCLQGRKDVHMQICRDTGKFLRSDARRCRSVAPASLAQTYGTLERISSAGSDKCGGFGMKGKDRKESQTMKRYISLMSEADMCHSLRVGLMEDVQEMQYTRLLMDNTSQMYAFSASGPVRQNVRDCFLVRMLSNAGYEPHISASNDGRYRVGDRILLTGPTADDMQDSRWSGCGMTVLVDGTDTANGNMIPLWVMGCLY